MKFTRKNVVADLKERRDSLKWNLTNLPLAEERKYVIEAEIHLLECILSDIWEMST